MMSANLVLNMTTSGAENACCRILPYSLLHLRAGSEHIAHPLSTCVFSPCDVAHLSADARGDPPKGAGEPQPDPPQVHAAVHADSA